jgi:hypothetical protein
LGAGHMNWRRTAMRTDGAWGARSPAVAERASGRLAASAQATPLVFATPKEFGGAIGLRAGFCSSRFRQRAAKADRHPWKTKDRSLQLLILRATAQVFGCTQDTKRTRRCGGAPSARWTSLYRNRGSLSSAPLPRGRLLHHHPDARQRARGRPLKVACGPARGDRQHAPAP